MLDLPPVIKMTRTTAHESRPTWELIDLFPHQGKWSVEEYLALDTSRMIEFTGGFLEFLPTPDEIHWEIQNYIFLAVQDVLKRRGKGVARYAPFRVRVEEGRFREPDTCVLLDENDPRRGRQFWGGADLVVEVVSADNPERDYWTKRRDYAAGAIPEYWIVDPQSQRVTVLTLSGSDYVEHGTYQPGQRATSLVLRELAVDVTEMLAAATRAAPNPEPGS